MNDPNERHHRCLPLCTCSKWKPISTGTKLIHATVKCSHLLPEDVKCTIF